MKPHPLVEQRKPFDCGVAAMSSWMRLPYEDVYAVAVSAYRRRLHHGLWAYQMRDIAKKLGRPLKTIHYRRIDLDEDAGILGINWDSGGSGHWVVLRRGTILDPFQAWAWDADEYLTVNQGRVGSLLTDA